MKILVLSHNVFSTTNNMGKTLLNYFKGCEIEDIAQFYVQDEKPSVKGICSSYYRFTDKDAIKSILSRNVSGIMYSDNDIADCAVGKNSYKSSISKHIYQRGSSRTPYIYLMRDFLWDLSNWYSSDLRKWIQKFKPDVIFLASGDYSFIYKIAIKISNDNNLPLVVCCVDDFYFYNKNESCFLGKYRQKIYMNVVKNTMQYASCIITICKKMSKEYGILFGKKTHVLYTSAEAKKIDISKSAYKIAYFGGLSLGRDKQLINIGRALKKIVYKGRRAYLDVYSFETNDNIIRNMNIDNGIIFHNGVSENEMLNIYKECLALVHTESFDINIVNRVKYSISTKIAESLMYGPCLIAYGPNNVASMEYLIESGSAFIITENDNLVDRLNIFFTDINLRKKILENARETAKNNHMQKLNNKKLLAWLKKVANK